MRRNEKGKRGSSISTVHDRLSQMESSLERILSDLDEIKENTSKKKRKFSLFSKGDRKRKKRDGKMENPALPTMEDEGNHYRNNGLDVGALLQNPMIKSMLSNHSNGGLMNLLKDMDPVQISKMLNNPVIKSMLKGR